MSSEVGEPTLALDPLMLFPKALMRTSVLGPALTQQPWGQLS